jgi:hypothetical protein
VTARSKYLYIFGIFGVVTGLLASVGLNIWAKVAVAGADVGTAASRATEHPIGIAILALPFVGAGVLASEVAVRTSTGKAITFLALLSGVLLWLYYRGHINAEHALAQQKWTAASLEIGLLPFMSVPVLIVAALLAGGLSWKFGKDES